MKLKVIPSIYNKPDWGYLLLAIQHCTPDQIRKILEAGITAIDEGRYEEVLDSDPEWQDLDEVIE